MPTIFDSSLEEQRKKQSELEKKLADIQEQAKQAELNSAEDGEKHSDSIFEQSQENIDVYEHSKESAIEPDSEPEPETETEPTSTPPIKPETPMTADTHEKHTKKSSRKPEDYSVLLREEKPSNGLFSDFMPQPPGVEFESQHEHEKILLVLRQHIAVNVIWIVIALVLILAPFLLFPMIPLQVVLPGNFLFFLMIAWYLFVTAYVIESFLGWYFNIYIITDERIIDIDFYSLIYKSVSEAKIEKIEDVTATTAGFFGAFFHYGNITIQTAAEKREFEFHKVPHPSKVTKFLNELMLEEEREKIEGRVM